MHWDTEVLGVQFWDWLFHSQTPRGKTRQLGKEQFREVRGFIKVQVQNKKRFPSFPWTEIQLWQHSIPIAGHHHPRRNLDLLIQSLIITRFGPPTSF